MHTASRFPREREAASFPMLCQSKESINEDVWRPYLQSQIGAIPDFAKRWKNHGGIMWNHFKYKSTRSQIIL